MKKILIINGPNLNKLGERELEIYGKNSLESIKIECQAYTEKLDLTFYQTNSESEIVESIQKAKAIFDGVIINAAAYTHTSIAIHDSLKILHIPIIEVHLSNPFKREDFRQKSFISPVADGIISGLGADVYKIAIKAMELKLEKNEKN